MARGDKYGIKRAMKNALTYGLALEVIAIGSGYLLYREYKTNKDFRETIEDQFPQLTEAFNAVSGLYLTVMPKRVRDQILEVNENDISPSSSILGNQTNPTTTKAEK